MTTATHDRGLRTMAKYLTIGLLIGLFFAPRSGKETMRACIASLQDLFGGLGGDEFAELE